MTSKPPTDRRRFNLNRAIRSLQVALAPPERWRIGHLSTGSVADALARRLTGGANTLDLDWTPGPLADDADWGRARQVLADADDLDVIIISGMSLEALASLFRLRAVQLAEGLPQIATPAIIVLPQTGTDVQAPAPGFARRARAGWPFRHTVFVTQAAAAEGLRREGLEAIDGEAAALLGLRGLRRRARSAAISPAASPSIAFQVQPLWGRCGSSTPFANQIDALIDSGAFVVRAFVDTADTPTGRHSLDRIVAENRLDTTPHLEALAYPPADTPVAVENRIDAVLLETAQRRAMATLTDAVSTDLAQRASVAIVNHAVNMGFALNALPEARLVLETHDYLTRAAVERHRIGADGLAIPNRAALRHHLELERDLLRAADLCTTVSLAERPKLELAGPDVLFTLPRPYVRRALDASEHATWDILLVGDLHPFNLRSADAFFELAMAHERLSHTRIAVAGAMAKPLAERWREHARQAEWLGVVADLDSLRDRCRLSVCPDMAGAGLSIKTLTAITAGHPMSATRFALRGLPRSITEQLPAAETLADLIDDTDHLLGDALALAQRRAQAGRLADALAAEPGYATALSQVSTDRANRVPARQALHLVLAEPTPLPIDFSTFDGQALVADFTTGGETHGMLGARWHGPEAHGRWTDGPTATLRLPTALITHGAWIDISCLTQSAPQKTRMSVAGQSWSHTLAPGLRQHMLARIHPIDAAHGPVTSLWIETDQQIRPIDGGLGNDDRVLGLCVERVTITPLPPPPAAPSDQAQRLSLVDDDTLIVRGGWHQAEAFGRWTAAPQSELVVTSKIPLGGPAQIRLELTKPPAGPVRLKVNDVDAGVHTSADAGDSYIDWRIDRIATDTVLRLDIQYDAVSEPRTLNEADSRSLGLAATVLVVDAQPALKAARPTPQPVRSVIFCKSFMPDLERFEHLARSILDNNASGLPLVITAPHADLAAFRHAAPAETTLIAEEEFVEPRCFGWLDGWRQQQVAKLAFHQLGLCERYIAVDADSYFIRPFTEEDLFGADGEIRIVAQAVDQELGYGVLPDDYELDLGRRSRAAYTHVDIKFGPGALRIPESFLRDRAYQACPPDLAWSLIPYAFSADRGARRINCLPPPMIFSAELLAELRTMIADQALTFTDLIHLSPWEADWYGYFALKYFGERVRTVSSMFRHFTTDAQIAHARAAGVTRETLTRNFLGLNLAARHQSLLEF